MAAQGKRTRWPMRKHTWHGNTGETHQMSHAKAHMARQLRTSDQVQKPVYDPAKAVIRNRLITSFL